MKCSIKMITGDFLGGGVVESVPCCFKEVKFFEGDDHMK